MNLQNYKIRPILRLVRQYSSETPTLTPDVKTMIRVNLAGETGADKIYAGQLAILGRFF